MSRNIGIFSSKDKSLSWWWFGIKVGIISALILWWWWLENQKKKGTPEVSGRAPSKEPESIPLPMEETLENNAPAEVVEASNAPTPADDLTKIEGIGPKINATLQEAGIRTYAQLAASKPAILKQILLDAGVRIGFPETWPEQAALAAKDKWDALAEFQSGLKGGRRID